MASLQFLCFILLMQNKKKHITFKFSNVNCVKHFFLSKLNIFHWAHGKPMVVYLCPWLLVGVKLFFHMIVKINLKKCTWNTSSDAWSLGGSRNGFWHGAFGKRSILGWILMTVKGVREGKRDSERWRRGERLAEQKP